MATRPQIKREIFRIVPEHSNISPFDEGFRLGDDKDDVSGLYMDSDTRKFFGRDVNKMINRLRKNEGKTKRRFFMPSSFKAGLLLSKLIDDSLKKVNSPDD